MDRRERGVDLMSGVLAALQGLQAGIYTALPGIIQSFDPAKRTVTIQPTLKAQVQAPNGDKSWVTLPLLVDCPVIFPGGGGFVLTFPLAQGTETLVIFASRCIDAWWQSGGIQVQAELRMHDLSDGFCLAGIASVPNVQPAISTANVQLRNDVGDTYIEITPDKSINVVTPGSITAEAGTTITATAGTGISLNAPEIELTIDNFEVNASVVATINAATINLNGVLVINGEPYLDHQHNNVENGGDISGGVV